MQWTEPAAEHETMLLHFTSRPTPLFSPSFYFDLMKNILENILFAFQLQNVMSSTIFIRNAKSEERKRLRDIERDRERSEKLSQSSYRSN